MFGAIIGVAAKLIGGAAGAGGAGGILGGLFGGGGGILGSLFNGGIAKEIFDMVSNFKTNFLGGADQQPPLGRFAAPNNSPAGGNRESGLDRLIDRIGSLLDRLESMRNADGGGCFGRIRNLLREFMDSTNSQNQVSFQFTRSQYTNIQV